MNLSYIPATGHRGEPTRVFVFDCDKLEKDIPKTAGFLFDLRGGVQSPRYKWTTKSADIARKLAQYADPSAVAALEAAGVNVEKAERDAIKREKALATREIRELAEMPEEERRREISKWLCFAEKDAENGRVGVNCEIALRKLRAFADPAAKARFGAAEERARMIRDAADKIRRAAGEPARDERRGDNFASALASWEAAVEYCGREMGLNAFVAEKLRELARMGADGRGGFAVRDARRRPFGGGGFRVFGGGGGDGGFPPFIHGGSLRDNPQDEVQGFFVGEI